MKARTKLIIAEPDRTDFTHDEIEISIGDDRYVQLQQGSDQVCINRTDISEFCRKLAEWEAGEPSND